MNNALTSSFIYVSCQHGAEATIKSQLIGDSGPFRLAYSQPGFLTFKTNFPTPIWTRGIPEFPLIRSAGQILTRLEGSTTESMMTEFVGSFLQLEWNGIHVWQRDIAQPGWNGFEPGNTPLASAVCDELRIALLRIGDRRSESINIPTSIGDKVIEVIIDAPNRWWIGSKIVQSTEACWPGGIFNIDKPDDMISRAYLKISEAMAWARWQIRPGDKVVEIGSSPGGSVQRLLDLGAKVTGIDPAEMDERIAKHPNFVHLRSRSLQVKRKLFRNFKYLICDANVAPKYTLDTVESIVTYPTSRFKALLLTMKLPSWEQSLEISSHLERVQSWGFERVMARQLSHNRQEYCLSALRLKTRDSASLKNVQEEQSRTEVDGESL